MIRLIQRRLIIPRGDTGTFTVPLLATAQTGDASVFTIFDQKTQKKVFEKIVNINGDALEIVFSHADTVNLPVGDYVWDIKFYKDPVIIDNVLVDGTEIDSYYAAFKLPVCEIRQTGDTLLIADDAPTSTIAPDQLNIILAATDEISAAKREVMNAAEAVEANTQTASDAATSATADAAQAETAAEAASTSALAASQSATDANSAKNSAVAANTAAQQALLDANLAATIATTKATEASASATAASNSASAASNSASAASSSANSAASSANSAAASVIQMDALVKTIPVNVSELNNDADYITDSDVPVKDIQVNGASIVDNGVANVPIANTPSEETAVGSLGLIKISKQYGFSTSSAGVLRFHSASSNDVKDGSTPRRMLTPIMQHESAFYGLAKAAGDATQAASSNAVGTYTDEAKAAIQQMLDVPSNGDLSTYATKTDTVLNTTLSRGRKEGTVVGDSSFAFGDNVEASGVYSFAQGAATYARGTCTHAEGNNAIADGMLSHAEGAGGLVGNIRFSSTDNPLKYLITSDKPLYCGVYICYNNTWAYITEIDRTNAIVTLNKTLGNLNNEVCLCYTGAAIGVCSHTEGTATIAIGDCQHAQGQYNIADMDKIYANIVGNGILTNRSNAYALTWTGDGRYAGDVYVHCNSDSTDGTKLLTAADLSTYEARIAYLEAEIESLRQALLALLGSETAVTMEDGSQLTDEQGNTIEYDTPTGG